MRIPGFTAEQALQKLSLSNWLLDSNGSTGRVAMIIPAGCVPVCTCWPDGCLCYYNCTPSLHPA